MKDTQNEAWAGRISLQVASEPPQSFAGSFELTGRAERGELRLLSPLGNVVGISRWTPDQAEFDSGAGVATQFQSMDELMEKATGAAIPIVALFSWLRGEAANVNGWSADLARHSEGRIAARRLQPSPQAELRVVLTP